MTNAPRFLFALACSTAAWAAQAHDHGQAPATQPHAAHAATSTRAVAVTRPYARATAAGQSVGAGYLTLTNPGAADRLLSASAPVSQTVELHTMSMDGTVMRMRQVDAIELPAGRTVELKPGGLHLMLMGLKAPLAAGSQFPLTLRFEKAGEVTVQVKVEAAGASSAGHGDHGHKH